MENETDGVVSGVSTLAMAVDQSGPLSFADILDLGAEVAGRLADQHDDGEAHGHVAPGAVVRLDDGPWRLAPAELIPDIDAVSAPELGSDGTPTPAADVYALGATLSYGLTGVPIDPVDADADAPSGTDDPLGPSDGLADTAEVADGDVSETAAADDAEDDDAQDDAQPSGERSVADLASIDLTTEPAAAPMTLPEVMSSFLVALRASLAVDPQARPSASDLAATLRQLRSDADSALGGALVGGVAAVAIGDGAGAEPWGAPLGASAATVGGAAGVAPDLADADAARPAPPDAGVLAVEGTGSAASLTAVGASATKKKKSLRERAPVLVATAAVLVAAVLGVSLVRERNEQVSDVLAAGPTVGTQVRRSTTSTTPIVVLEVPLETTTSIVTSSTSSSSTTTPEVVETVPDTTVPTTVPTTAPPTTLPPTTLPPTTATTRPPQAGVPVTIACGTVGTPCPVSAYSEPTTASDEVIQFPNSTQLLAQCAKDGELVGGSKVWLRIIGQGQFFWIPTSAATYARAPQPCVG